MPSTAVNDHPDFEVRSPDPQEGKRIHSQPPLRSNLPYLLVGVLFGIVSVKAEIVSWFRIQEMFRLQSFHMYGVMGSAVLTGMLSVWAIKRLAVRTLGGEKVVFRSKKFNRGQVYGGLIFGLGWATTGACPGPLFAQIGSGSTVMVVSLLSAVAGTWAYGYFREKLPH